MTRRSFLDEAIHQATLKERERILSLKKEIINCVIDYGLMPEQYERICKNLEELIKGETNE